MVFPVQKIPANLKPPIPPVTPGVQPVEGLLLQQIINILNYGGGPTGGLSGGPPAMAFASLPSAPIPGMLFTVNDALTNTAGSSLTAGGGTHTVEVMYSGESNSWVILGGFGSVSSGTVGIIFVSDGAGSPLTSGIKLDLQIPFNCEVTAWTLLADQTGSIVVDVWHDAYSNYPPTVADSITGGAPPTIVGNNKATGGVAGWQTSITAGDTLRFNINSVSTIQRITLILDVVKV